MTFQGGVEDAVTRLLFRQDRSQGIRYGLLAPLYWWTHRALNADAAVAAECDAAALLAHHFINIDRARAVTFVAASAPVCDGIRQRFNATAALRTLLPQVCLLADLVSSNVPKSSVAVFCMGGYANASLANCLRGEAIQAVFNLGTAATIVLGHALWASYGGPTHPITIGIRKFNESWAPVLPEKQPKRRQHHRHRRSGNGEAGLDSAAADAIDAAAHTDDEEGDAAAEREPLQGLMHGVLPLCCPLHPQQIFLARSDDLKTPEAAVKFCRRLCLQPYSCHRHLHVCLEPCHVRLADVMHANCRYACEQRLSCGHMCRARCGAPCNCLERAQTRLPCSHELQVGSVTDPATGVETKKITRTVDHVFDGACVQRDDPCEVPVPVDCRFCSGPMTLPCHVVRSATATTTAPTAQLSDASVDGAAPTTTTNGPEDDDPLAYFAVCGECVALRARLHDEVRVDLLREADKERTQRRREAQGQAHEQAKAASTGVFTEGQRVAIRDVGGLRGEIPDLFPEVDAKPAGNRWSDADFTSLLGDHGRVVGRHVDITDTSEVLYLVALARGGHIVVADVGLELLRANIRTTGTAGGGADDIGGGSVLLITGGPSAASAYHQHQANNSSTNGDVDDASKTATGESAEELTARLLAKFPIGSTVHCVAPARVVSRGDTCNDLRGDAATVRGAGADGSTLNKNDADHDSPAPDPESVDGDADAPADLETDVCGVVVRVAAQGGLVTVRCERVHFRFKGRAGSSASTTSGDASDADHNGDPTEPSSKSARTEGGQLAAAASGRPAPARPADAPEVEHVIEVFTIEATEESLEPLLHVGDLAIAREPRRHVHAAAERAFFAPVLPAELTTFLPVPLPPNEPVVVKAVVNYPKLDVGVSAVFGKSRGPCYVVSPVRDTVSATTRVALCPVVFVEPDADARAERDLHRDLQARLRSRVAALFQERVESRYVENIANKQKRLGMLLRMYNKSVADNGGKPPVKTASWGGGADASLLAAAAKDHAGEPLHRSNVAAAVDRDRAMAARDYWRDFSHRWSEMAGLADRQDQELRAALTAKPTA